MTCDSISLLFVAHKKLKEKTSKNEDTLVSLYSLVDSAYDFQFNS
jgi:hypothetical protein